LRFTCVKGMPERIWSLGLPEEIKNLGNKIGDEARIKAEQTRTDIPLKNSDSFKNLTKYSASEYASVLGRISRIENVADEYEKTRSKFKMTITATGECLPYEETYEGRWQHAVSSGHMPIHRLRSIHRPSMSEEPIVALDTWPPSAKYDAKGILAPHHIHSEAPKPPSYRGQPLTPPITSPPTSQHSPVESPQKSTLSAASASPAPKDYRSSVLSDRGLHRETALPPNWNGSRAPAIPVNHQMVRSLGRGSGSVASELLMQAKQIDGRLSKYTTEDKWIWQSSKPV